MGLPSLWIARLPVSAPDGFTWETPAEDLDERCGACGGKLRYAVCVDCGMRHFGVEYRDVGEHEFKNDGPNVGIYACCRHCGAGAWSGGACPSVQERRLVGPWEPAPKSEREER